MPGELITEKRWCRLCRQRTNHSAWVEHTMGQKLVGCLSIGCLLHIILTVGTGGLWLLALLIFDPKKIWETSKTTDARFHCQQCGTENENSLIPKWGKRG